MHNRILPENAETLLFIKGNHALLGEFTTNCVVKCIYTSSNKLYYLHYLFLDFYCRLACSYCCMYCIVLHFLFSSLSIMCITEVNYKSAYIGSVVIISFLFCRYIGYL